MKKLFFIAAAVLLFAACATKNEKADGSAAASASPDMPYTMETPYRDWQSGDKANAVVVMKMLKAWETKNIAECAACFGDTAVLFLDYYHKRLSHDSITPFLERSLADLDKITIKMEDWESVTSGDKKEEWVTVWYKQTWTDKKGKADSLNISDDARLEGGKIVAFDERIQHFPEVKK